MSLEFASATLFLESATSQKDKLDKITALLDALLLVMTSAALNEEIEEYWLDDGQTRIKASYRGVEGILKSYNSLLALQQLYLNRLNGRQMSLKDAGSINIRHLRHGS